MDSYWIRLYAHWHGEYRFRGYDPCATTDELLGEETAAFTLGILDLVPVLHDSEARVEMQGGYVIQSRCSQHWMANAVEEPT